MTGTILYVDDEWANRVVFEQSFGATFRVRTLGSPHEALELMGKEPIAVLITDQRMPEMGGNELLEHAKLRFPETVRMVITAYSDLDPILKAVNDGLVARYVVKPWNRAEMEAILAWALEAHTLGWSNSALLKRVQEFERLATLGTIASAVFHDISQPISHIGTDAYLLGHLASAGPDLADLLARHGDGLKPEARQRLEHLSRELPEIAASIGRGATMLNEVLGTATRLLGGSAPPNRGSADPLPAIRHALAVCRNLVLQSRASLDYQGEDSLPAVTLSDTEVTQIVINLVANASHAVGQLQRRRGRVRVQGRALANAVEITVADDGPGMTGDVLERVGRPFFSTRPDGSGLGLAQCRRLVERSGGKMLVESQEGLGTTVTCLLPRVLDPTAPS